MSAANHQTGLSAPTDLDPEIAAGTWVIIPVYNEATVISDVIGSIRTVFPNVVAIDDGSTDGSWDQVRRSASHPLRHLVNRGQGAARIAHFDADGQHRLEDVCRMVEVVASGECDIALGNRFAGDVSQVPPARRVLLRAAVLFHRIASGIELHDVHNGLRVLSRRAAERMEITADRMAHASEIIDLVARSGLPVQEIPVTIRYSEYSRAKGQRWTGGFRIMFHYLIARILG